MRFSSDSGSRIVSCRVCSFPPPPSPSYPSLNGWAGHHVLWNRPLVGSVQQSQLCSMQTTCATQLLGWELQEKQRQPWLCLSTVQWQLNIGVFEALALVTNCNIRLATRKKINSVLAKKVQCESKKVEITVFYVSCSFYFVQSVWFLKGHKVEMVTIGGVWFRDYNGDYTQQIIMEKFQSIYRGSMWFVSYFVSTKYVQQLYSDSCMTTLYIVLAYCLHI